MIDNKPYNRDNNPDIDYIIYHLSFAHDYYVFGGSVGGGGGGFGGFGITFNFCSLISYLLRINKLQWSR
jgi:hypothetical protein